MGDQNDYNKQRQLHADIQLVGSPGNNCPCDFAIDIGRRISSISTISTSLPIGTPQIRNVETDPDPVFQHSLYLWLPC